MLFRTSQVTRSGETLAATISKPRKMKKFLFTIILLSTLISCNNQQVKPVITKRKIDPILEDILKKNSNYKENTIVRENATKLLDKKIDSILNLGLLDDIPLKLFNLEKNPHGKGALLQFKTDNYDFEKPEVLSDRLTYDVIGLMDEKLATTLIENEKYYVYGKKLKRLSKDEVFLIVSQVYHSPETEISKGIIGEEYDFNIGDILMEIDSVKIVK